jgi:uncharacterized protein YndB with AHSA1/START domain
MTDGPGTTLSQAAIHGSFTVERDLTASPDRVYAAYADTELRRRWFRMPGARSRT